MIFVTKEECEKLKELLGDRMPHIAITSVEKKGRRKKRYMEENRQAMKLLEAIREKDCRRDTIQ